ncbi:MAG: hypothetical protein E7374_00260 [Clostridiales bacterium]|nr:hypothetical protein [Clostridiales bacterium]
MDRNDLEILIKAFPASLKEDVLVVSKLISNESYLENSIADNISGFINFTLSNGEIIALPERVYYKDCRDIKKLNTTQQLIYFCIFTRCCDGYIRQKSVNQILNLGYEDWCLPYIIKLADSYVIEILDNLYSYFSNKDCVDLKKFCSINKDYMQKANSRMVSYWNEYYRNKNIDINNYVGKKLFVECFGIDKK